MFCCEHVRAHRKSINEVTHIPVDSSAARMPFPGATILWAMSCSSFFCSGVSAGYWWVMAAGREREIYGEVTLFHGMLYDTCSGLKFGPFMVQVFGLQNGHLAAALRPKMTKRQCLVMHCVWNICFLLPASWEKYGQKYIAEQKAFVVQQYSPLCDSHQEYKQ